MHIGVRVMLAAAMLSIAAPRGQAQETPPAAEPRPLDPELRSIDFGARVTSIDGDAARAQRYRDLRDGPVLDRLRWTRADDAWLLGAQADHVGYRDQHYGVQVRQFGRVAARFDWNQIPLFISDTTRTLFTTESPGVLRVDDRIQQAIQAGTLSLADASAEAVRFDTRSRRDIANVDFLYRAAKDLDTKFAVTTTHREGAQPWGAGFGFANDVETPVPIDTRSTDVAAGLEWSRRGTLLRMAYDGSWFDNAIPSLVWDNPLRATDSASAPAQGRQALWPSSNSQTVSATGSVALPARSRATAYVSRGMWNQNETLLPHTINSAIASPPLARPTAEAEAAVTSVMLRVTSRPRTWSWFNATYRRYDFDNRTPPLLVPEIVNYDSAPAASTLGTTEALSFTRGLLELDASLTPWKHGAFKLGYSREAVDRTFRQFETTTEQSARAAYDLTTLTWMTVRTSYLHAKRVGKGLDEEALSDIGEQVSLRQFDISDRVRDQGTVLLFVTPASGLSLNLSAGAGKDDRPDAQFGLTDTTFRVYTLGADLTPREGVTFGVTGGRERYASRQNSRQANPGAQFDDPTRDWATDGLERVTSVGVTAQILDVIPRTRVNVAYDYNRSTSSYLYLLPVDTTLPAVSQLPPIRNDWHQATLDVRHEITRRVLLSVRYAYDRLRVDDFAFNPSTLDRLVFPSTLLLGSVYQPYTVNTVTVKLTYLW